MKFITLVSAGGKTTSKVNPLSIVYMGEPDERYKAEFEAEGVVGNTIVTFSNGDSVAVRETVEEIERLCE